MLSASCTQAEQRIRETVWLKLQYPLRLLCLLHFYVSVRTRTLVVLSPTRHAFLCSQFCKQQQHSSIACMFVCVLMSLHAMLT